ncbi:MAG: hypothetical protein OHK0015_04710 [Chloroflexi bacterium OHK40]
MQTNAQTEKQTYEAPRLTVHGSVEELTQGAGSRTFLDFLVFGRTDPRGIPLPPRDS